MIALFKIVGVVEILCAGTPCATNDGTLMSESSECKNSSWNGKSSEQAVHLIGRYRFLSQIQCTQGYGNRIKITFVLIRLHWPRCCAVLSHQSP